MPARYRNALLLAIAAVLVVALALSRSTLLVPAPPPPTPTVAPTLTPLPTFTPTFAPGTPTPEPSATPSRTPTLAPTATATTWPTALPVATPAPPADLGRLIIPKLSVDAKILPVPIIDGDWDVKRVVMEVGWLAGTSPVGSRGNTGIAAHVSLKCCGDGPFRWLEKLVPGDELILKTDQQTYRYRVTELRVVDPTEVSVMGPTADPQLTLVTCNDWDYLKSEFVKRLIVIAK